jgi:hypothetical protein
LLLRETRRNAEDVIVDCDRKTRERQEDDELTDHGVGVSELRVLELFELVQALNKSGRTASVFTAARYGRILRGSSRSAASPCLVRLAHAPCI